MWTYNYTNELYHHGILGMKWGKRNGPPYPLNESDKSRAERKASSMSDDELAKRVKRLNLEQQYQKMTKEKPKPSKLENAKNAVDSTSKLVNKAKEMNNKSIKNKTETLDLSSMTDQELRDKINRYNLEKQYNDIFGKNSENVSKGQAYVAKTLDIAGDVVGLAGSAIAIALSIKGLKGG